MTGVAAPSQAVTFNAPTVAEGAPPVNATCSPASGANFPLGATTVSCAANDAMSRQATCSFNVTLKGMAIAVKKYDAIGDSVTEGQNGEPDPRFVDPPNSYPAKLQIALDGTYPGQGIGVITRGAGGASIETIVQNVVKFVTADRPDAVLVEGGYNDLLADCGNGSTNTTACRNAISRVGGGIRDCIRKATERNVSYVFVATMTPPGPLQPGAERDRRISNDAIMQANSSIRQVVASERAVLVDVYPLFIGHEAEYVDTDGLHLRPAGYQAMADAFFAAIQRTIPQSPLFGFTSPR